MNKQFDQYNNKKLLDRYEGALDSLNKIEYFKKKLHLSKTDLVEIGLYKSIGVMNITRVLEPQDIPKGRFLGKRYIYDYEDVTNFIKNKIIELGVSQTKL